MRILLAEDNEVNQALAVALLTKRGHSISIANNGQEALQALDKETFDLVLMDVQMPVMSGFEATAAIRANENKTGLHIPIVAMTAHAMKGDRESCLKAGMDAYVSKPIKASELIEAIESVAGRLQAHTPALQAESLAPAPAKTPAPQAAPLIDGEALLATVDGDFGLLRTMVNLFLTDTPAQMQAIQAALEANNAGDLYRLAHALKGAVSNFSSEPVTQTALRLEMMGRELDLANAREAYQELEQMIGRLTPELSAFVETSLQV